MCKMETPSNTCVNCKGSNLSDDDPMCQKCLELEKEQGKPYLNWTPKGT